MRLPKAQLKALLLLFTMLFGLAPPAFAADQKGPLILAAASLQEALNDAAASYAAKGHPKPVISFGGSSALARQIEAGAPADIFISADEAWMDYVSAKGLVKKDTRKSFLTNQLVLVTPKAKPLKITIRKNFPLAGALGDSRLAMADPNAVPAGKYGKAALTSLGVWQAVEPKMVSADNVRSALQFVARGEARAGIVYRTDALAEPAVTVAGVFPAASHTPITYPVAVLARSANPEALGFRAFLLSRAGGAIFRKYGFGTR